MHSWARRGLSAAAVIALAAGLLTVGAALSSPDRGDGPAEVAELTAAPEAAETGLTAAITALQARLAQVPGNHQAWSQLGLAYVQQARLTADPGLYGRADGAFAKALALRPQDNDTALTGRASLAAARHDFAGALALTDQSLKINGFSPTTYAVRVDALHELGRYDEAGNAARQLLDLQPNGVDALTRASYASELRGDAQAARLLLEQAVEAAGSPADKAFGHYYLGELAWSSGDLAGARAAYDRGLAADPGSMQLVAGRAKVLAASGQPVAAAAEYRLAVEQLPLPEFLVAYGELLESTGQKAAAAEQYAVLRATQKLYAANGQDVDTELALFEADHGTPAAALASARKAYAKRPASIFTQDAYAWALHAAGRSREALPIARQAVRLGFVSPAMQYRLGAIAAAAGDEPLARAALGKALALNPTFSPLYAPKAEALLKALG